MLAQLTVPIFTPSAQNPCPPQFNVVPGGCQTTGMPVLTAGQATQQYNAWAASTNAAAPGIVASNISTNPLILIIVAAAVGVVVFAPGAWKLGAIPLAGFAYLSATSTGF